MAIKILLDITKATPEEMENFSQVMNDQEFFLTKLFNEDNIEVVRFTEKDEQIAKDNGCTLAVGLEKNVILGCFPREVAENMAKEQEVQ